MMPSFLHDNQQLQHDTRAPSSTSCSSCHSRAPQRPLCACRHSLPLRKQTNKQTSNHESQHSSTRPPKPRHHCNNNHCCIFLYNQARHVRASPPHTPRNQAQAARAVDGMMGKAGAPLTAVGLLALLACGLILFDLLLYQTDESVATALQLLRSARLEEPVEAEHPRLADLQLQLIPRTIAYATAKANNLRKSISSNVPSPLSLP